MELNNTTSLFEIFTGFNLLYSLSKPETFAMVINERIVKPYDKSKDYITIILGEIDFYSQSTIQLLDRVDNSQNIDLYKKEELQKEIYELDNLIVALEKELNKSYERTLNRIESDKKKYQQLLDRDFSQLSLFFAFFSIQALYIIPTTNNHRIFSICFLDITSIVILLAILFRHKIEKFTYKLNFFNIFSIEINPIVNIFLFRISTWRSFTHVNIVLLFFRITIACFIFHFLVLKDINYINYSNSFYMIKDLFHRNKNEIEAFIIIVSTLIPISHFIYISVISIMKSIRYQLLVFLQSHTKGKDSLRIIRHKYNRISEEFNLLS